MSYLIIFVLALVQNISFSMVSRSRNRDHKMYHAICSVLSNGLFFLTFKYLYVSDFSIELVIPYMIGSTIGSIFGAELSMKIEKLIGAKT